MNTSRSFLLAIILGVIGLTMCVVGVLAFGEQATWRILIVEGIGWLLITAAILAGLMGIRAESWKVRIAQQANLQSEHAARVRLERLFNESADIAFRWKPDKGFEYINTAALNFCGRGSEECRGEPDAWNRFVIPEHHRSVQNAIDSCHSHGRTTEPVNIQLTDPKGNNYHGVLTLDPQYTPDGTLQSLFGLLKPIGVGNSLALVATHTSPHSDAGQPQSQDPQVHQYQQQITIFSDLVNQIPMSILVTDQYHVLQYINPAAEHLFDLGDQEITGKSAYLLSAEEQPDRLREEIVRSIEAQGTWLGQIKWRTLSKRQFKAMVHVGCARSQTNRPIAYLYFLSTFNPSERGAPTDGGKDDPQTRSAPLRMMYDYVYQLIGFPEQGTDLATYTRKNARWRQMFGADASTRDISNRIAALINVHLSQNHFPNAVPVDQLIDQGLELCPGAPNIEVSLALDERLQSTRGDQEQLAHLLLLPILDNCLRALPNGGEITIEAANMTLGKGAVQNHPDALPGPYVRLAITDSGPGVTTEELQLVDLPFFSTHNRVGLGLVFAKCVATIHKGFIEILSSPGQGMRVEVYLPAAPRD